MDPTRRRSGGALLGDRIRMNSLADEQIFMRSLATRRQNLATSAVLADTINLLKCAGFDLIVVETAGIGQSDTEIVDLVDVPVYVMTSEYGAASQLEKIDMLDFAELIALNKFEKRGAEDALRDVRKQWRRNHPTMKLPDDEIPVFPTIASRFNDPGRQPAVRRALRACSIEKRAASRAGQSRIRAPMELVERHALCRRSARAIWPRSRRTGGARARTCSIAPRLRAARTVCTRRCSALGDPLLPAPLERYADAALADASDPARARLRDAYNDALDAVGAEAIELLQAVAGGVEVGDRRGVSLRGARPRDHAARTTRETLSRNRVPKLAVPSLARLGRSAHASCCRRTCPAHFPYTAGVYPYRREEEDPTRMFAGEGGPERTNRRFHYVAAGHGAARLSTAFDSTTLYGEDPGRAARHLRPHRQLGRVDRHARRHEEALLGLRSLRPDDFGVDDDQRPGADDPRDVHERRDRPAGRAASARERRLGGRGAEDRRAATATASGRATRASCRRTTTARGSGCSA